MSLLPTEKGDEPIADQINKFEKVKMALNNARRDLEKHFSQLNIIKRHPAINPEELLGPLLRQHAEALAKVEELAKQHPDINTEDAILKEIEILFDGKVGAGPDAQISVDKWIQEAKKRTTDGMPPGYKDKDKDRSSMPFHHYRGLRIDRAAGDYIIWRQTLDEIQNKKIKYMIFVIDDAKEDWWNIIDCRGDKIIGPRPELVDEAQNAGLCAFLMYRSERFLEFASKQFGLGVSQETIDQVEEVNRNIKAEAESSNAANEETMAASPNETVEIVADWLLHQQSRSCIISWSGELSCLGHFNFDIAIKNRSEQEIIELALVKYYGRRYGRYIDHLKYFLAGMRQFIQTIGQQNTKLRIVIACPDSWVANYFERRIRTSEDLYDANINLPSRIVFSIGIINFQQKKFMESCQIDV